MTTTRTITGLAALVAAVLTLGAAASAEASYSGAIAGDTLTLTGNGAADGVALRLAPGGTTLQVDVGLDGTANLSFDRNRFSKIVVNAGGGNDFVKLEEGPGAFFSDTERATLRGDGGADTLIGGIGAETLEGGSANDILRGGRDNDIATGGAGADLVAWSPGDGRDAVNGGDGDDRLEMDGSDLPEAYVLFPSSLNPGEVVISRDTGNDGANATVETIDVDMNAGNDHFGTIGELAGRGELDVNGGTGNDVIQTSNGDDTLAGGPDEDNIRSGPGADALDGEAGDDRLFGEAGADTLTIRSGGGNERADGGTEADVLHVNGSAADEQFTIESSGQVGNVRIKRDGITRSDTFDIERLELDAAGGNDRVTGGTDLAGVMKLLFSGGAGQDTVLGGDGEEVIAGGSESDVLSGGLNTDILLGEGGDDVAFSLDARPGELIEGGPGFDRAVIDPADAPAADVEQSTFPGF